MQIIIKLMASDSIFIFTVQTPEWYQSSHQTLNKTKVTVFSANSFLGALRNFGRINLNSYYKINEAIMLAKKYLSFPLVNNQAVLREKYGSLNTVWS